MKLEITQRGVRFRMSSKYDVLIKNGRVLDGTGNPWYYADVGIVGDSIKAIGHLRDTEANKVIDVEGMVVAPGFIDIHSHSDVNLLVDPNAQSKIRQGVTTEVVGNCGGSAAPMNQSVKDYKEKYGRRMVPDEFKYDWTSMGDYIKKVEKQGVALNVAAHVGHGTVRQNVMGHEDRKPTPEELEAMKKLVAQAMEDGARGMSTGLIYPPSVYAETEEIIELAKIVAKYDGVYASHIRGEGETLLKAIEEAARVGKESGCPVQIAHFKSSGKPYWGRSKQALELVEKYRNEGVDITFDQYPYIASSTGLTALLPHWAHDGGAEKMLERLKDPYTRRKMQEEQRLNYDWTDIMVVYAQNNPQYNGKNIQEISEVMGKDPWNTLCSLLIMEDTVVPAVMFGMDEEDVRRIMQAPFGMIGSDGSAVSPEGVLGKGRPHPRFYGTFVRVIGHYVREGVISLQEAVRKMTSAPAQRLGLKDRGLLIEGYKADIVVFDPETVKDEATFTDPHRYASGVPYVLVNGELVVEKGEHTGKLPGVVLRKS